MNTVIRSFARINIVALPAALVTVLLFFIMQSFIAFNGDLPAPNPYKISTNITIPDEMPDIKTTSPKPPEPVEVVKPPLIARDTSATTHGADYGHPVEIETVEAPEFDNTLGLTEGNALALVQLQPTYPQRALAKGIEGYVVLEFNVSVNGSVVDPSVLISEPAGVFDRAALKAIAGWKYQPKIANGKAVKMYGVQKKMVFTIED